MSFRDGLTRVLDRLSRHREYYKSNETAVRDQLINPTLRLLDWDPEDPDKVQPNVSTEEGIPDYVLLKEGKRRLLLEAKNLSVDVESDRVVNQLARYSFAEGVPFGLITNGSVWRLVRSFEEGKALRERVVWQAHLEKETPSSVERKLRTVSWENVDQIETLVRKLETLDGVWDSVLSRPKMVASALLPVVQKSIESSHPSFHFEADEIESFLRERVGEITRIAPHDSELEDESEIHPPQLPSTSPPRMRIGRETHELRHSYEILVNVGNWLVRERKLTAAQCPVPIGRKRNLVHTEPRHRHGDDFLAGKKLVNGLWIETHYSKAHAIKNARRLLERFSVRGDSLTIEGE